MNPLLDYLARNWLALVVLLAGVLALLAVLVRRRQLQRRMTLAVLPGAALVIAAVGALILPQGWALWIALAGIVGVFIAVFLLLITGWWSRSAGWAVGAVSALGLGGLCLPTLAGWLWDGARNLTSLEVMEPAWLHLSSTTSPAAWACLTARHLPCSFTRLSCNR
jgi:hypothetical protein